MINTVLVRQPLGLKPGDEIRYEYTAAWLPKSQALPGLMVEIHSGWWQVADNET